jgi:hypothetical protein
LSASDKGRNVLEEISFVKHEGTFFYNIDHTSSRALNYIIKSKYDSTIKKPIIAKNQEIINKNKIHPVRLSLVVGGMFTAWLGMHIYYSQTWWKDRVHYFKYAEDTYYARNVDKMSHVYTANLITEGSAALYEWSGIKPMPAVAFGSMTAVAYETYIEMYDGISPIWGFDWGDMAANFIGALYPIAQRYVPVLNNINVKWSFDPKWIQRKVQNQFDLLDDYTSMIFWVSINPKGFLPEKLSEYYPGFLAFALGVSIKGASHLGSSANAYSELYLAFDVDITRLPGKSEFMKKFKKLLNFYHLPMPTVRIHPTGVWYGIHY